MNWFLGEGQESCSKQESTNALDFTLWRAILAKQLICLARMYWSVVILRRIFDYRLEMSVVGIVVSFITMVIGGLLTYRA
jgi:hypothetical protein